MSQAGSVQNESAAQIVSRLDLIGSLDTLYRDIYMQRARELTETFMSNAAYTNIKNDLASLGLVERQLRTAVDRGDWAKTAELTERVRAIRGAAAGREKMLELAEVVYDKLADVPIDPFSPGFYAFYGCSAETLNEWRQRAVSTLTALERADSSKADFYARRRADFQALEIGAVAAAAAAEKKKEDGGSSGSSPTDLRQQALSALDSGDLSQFDDLLLKLQQASAASSSSSKEEKEESAVAVELAEAAELGDDLNYSFSEATLAAAARLGLAAGRTRSRRSFAYLLPYGWQPSYTKTESKKWAKEQLSHLSLPSTSGDKMRDAVELYLLNPLINSGGARYQVCLVEEDLLFEDFAEPEPRTPLPRTELLDALGFENRWGLSRREIENALLHHGARIIKNQLGLDPLAFRLVAIPPDIYTHFGPERGWGQKEMWTHFDGYWVREGNELQALAGGDKRFGGAHDVMCFHPSYTNDKLLTRFAVVQRKRMMSWQKR
jgi:hypothetical protein